jgi:hypothetical protein
MDNKIKCYFTIHAVTIQAMSGDGAQLRWNG